MTVIAQIKGWSDAVKQDGIVVTVVLSALVEASDVLILVPEKLVNNWNRWESVINNFQYNLDHMRESTGCTIEVVSKYSHGEIVYRTPPNMVMYLVRRKHDSLHEAIVQNALAAALVSAQQPSTAPA